MRQVKTKKKGLSLKTKMIISIILVVFIGLVLFFLSPPGKFVVKQTQAFIKTAQDKAHLSLYSVQISGHARTSKEDVMRVLNIAQGMPIFDVDLEEVRSQVSTLPWVKSVLVERHLPSSLFIVMREKTPIAVWQNHKRYFPLDQEGKPIADDQTVLNNLILVVGEDAPAHTPQLIESLGHYPMIEARVRSAVRIGGRRWNLVLHDLENGITIYLPDTTTEMERALKRLQRLQETQQILDKDFKVIDLRIEDRLIVRTTADIDDKDRKK